VGRTEREVAGEVGLLMKSCGHEEVNFVIVAAGNNSADPHHEPDDTVIERDQIVLFDIGGKLKGYCSDITRCLYLGKKIPDDIRLAYDVLAQAQLLAHEAIRSGTPAKDIDAAARNHLAKYGYGDMFIHSLGHGLGLDQHEDPFVTRVNENPVQEGDVFSNEPGIYNPAAGWGMRIEDVEVVLEGKGFPLNHADRDLICLDA
jgi:Xaa-Pro dipeptidase